MKMTIFEASGVGINDITKDDVHFTTTFVGGVISVIMDDASMVDYFEVYSVSHLPRIGE